MPEGAMHPQHRLAVEEGTRKCHGWRIQIPRATSANSIKIQRLRAAPAHDR